MLNGEIICNSDIAGYNGVVLVRAHHCDDGECHAQIISYKGNSIKVERSVNWTVESNWKRFRLSSKRPLQFFHYKLNYYFHEMYRLKIIPSKLNT